MQVVPQENPTKHDLIGPIETLRHLACIDLDRRVRHRADALLLNAQGQRVEAAALALGWSPTRVRTWRRRFLADGRDGLAARPCPGRPTAIGDDAWLSLRTALAESQLVGGYPVATWTLAELRDLHAHHGWEVWATTVTRTLYAREITADDRATN